MSGVILAASVDQYTEVKLWTTADGLPKTDAVFNTSGLSIKYQIGNAAVQSVTVGGSPAPASMSAGGAHADWGIYHIGNGWYKIGLADAVVATAGSRVRVWIELTDCDSAPAEIYVSGYDGSLVAVGASTFDHTADEVTTDEASRTASRADVSGLASQSSVDTIDGIVDSIRSKTDNLPADPADASDIAGAFGSVATALDTIAAYIDTEVAAIKTKTDNLPNDPATETTLATLDGLIDAIKAVTDQITFTGGLVDATATATVDTGAIADAVWGESLSDHTTEGSAGHALDNVPSADLTPVLARLPESGRAATASQVSPTIDFRPTITPPAVTVNPTPVTVDGGFTADDRGKLNSLGSGNVASSSPVAASGTINGPIVIGDDYLAVHGRAFLWTVDAVPGFQIANVTVLFGLAAAYRPRVVVEGSASVQSVGRWTLSIDLPRSATSALQPGQYDWSVEVRDRESGSEITRVRNAGTCQRVALVAKQTGGSPS